MHKVRSLVAKYRVAIGTIFAALVICAGTLTMTYIQTDERVKALERQSRETSAALDVQIAAVRAEKARQEAEQKRKTAEEEKKQSKTATSPKPATQKASTSPHRDPSKVDVVVNKKNPLIPLSYAPSLVTISCAGNGSTTINPVAQANFIALCSAAKKAGVPLATSSSYRSYQTQVSTYNHWVSVSGQAGADRYSARPGYSEHQTGLAVDFQVPGGASLSDFTGTAQQKWLTKNAWKYGFIQRYPTTNSATTGYDAESWHYRYIGKSYADSYTSSSAGSLEKFWGIKGGDY